MNAIIIYIFIYVAALRERRKKREEEEKSQQTPLKTTIDPSTSVNPLSTTKIASTTTSRTPFANKQSTGDIVPSKSNTDEITSSSNILSPVPTSQKTVQNTSTPSIETSLKSAVVDNDIPLPPSSSTTAPATTTAEPVQNSNEIENEKTILLLQNQLSSQTNEMNSLKQSLEQLTTNYESKETLHLHHENEYKNEIILLKENINQLTQQINNTPPPPPPPPLPPIPVAPVALVAPVPDNSKELEILKTQINDYQLQISELNDTIEMLSLDQEQLLVEKELNDEILSKLQSNTDGSGTNNSTSIDPTSSTTDSAIQLNEENIRLREALKRLHQVSSTETTQLKNDVIKLNDENKTFKSKLNDLQQIQDEYMLIKEENDELKQIVDSAGAYESMIENLTQINLDLTTKLQQTQASLHDIEMEQELMEELDGRQRQEIDSLRQEVDSMNITIITHEKNLNFSIDKLTESKTNEEKYKKIIEEHKQEYHLLNMKLSQYEEISKSQEKRSKDVTDVKLEKVSIYEEFALTKKYITSMEKKLCENEIMLQRYKSSFGALSIFASENITLSAVSFIIDNHYYCYYDNSRCYYKCVYYYFIHIIHNCFLLLYN